MSVEGIIERIIFEAKEEAKKIISNAKTEADDIVESLKKEADGYFENQKKQLENKYRNNKERAILSNRLENRKGLLQVRQKWMDEAFNSAYKALADQPFRDYHKLVIKLIGSISSDKDEEILFGKKGSDTELKKLVSDLNKGLNGKFTLAKERGNFEWGFILRKGKIKTDVTINSLFRYNRDELEQRSWEIFNVTE